MKKGKKRIWIWAGLVLGLILLAAGTFFLVFYLQIRKMNPAETAQVNDSVWCIRDRFVNAFLFRGDNGYIMVDAGMDCKSVEQELKKLNIRPEEVRTVLLTHSDGDHSGGLGLFPHAKVYMHKDEEQMVNGTNGKFFFMRYKWEYPPYILFGTSDTLHLDGWKIAVIHTPGHTPGSCCFLLDGKYLVTGDNTIVKEGRFEHFVPFFNMDTRRQEESIKSLPDPASVTYILTAHNGIIRNGSQCQE